MSLPGISILTKKSRSAIAFTIGLLVVIAYWFWVRPLNPGPGYLEDFCWDLSRRVMAQNLARYGKPVFTTDLFMAPYGMTVPFFSWSIERDWLGAYFWAWDKNFPFIWVYYLFSLLLTYFGVAVILARMGIARSTSWILATFVAVFQVPRHFATWYHVEYLSQHWAVLGIFLDVWVWQRFTRHQRWSWTLELWRVFLLIAVLGTPGYFWGPMALEWVVVRGSMLATLPFWWQRKEKSESPAIRVEGTVRQAVLPLVLSALWLVAEIRWFVPLVTEMKKLGPISQSLSWWANPLNVIRPLWLDRIFDWAGISIFPPIDEPETVVTIGWLYWIPAVLGGLLLRRRRGGPGLKTVAPYLVLLAIAIGYFGFGPFPLLHWPVQNLIPFMAFFRVASRWGHFLSYFVSAIIVLAWPELSAWIKLHWNRHRKRLAIGLAAFAVMGALEISWLLTPLLMQPPLLASTERLLEHVRELPGSMVLDMPFCVAGGNGVCTTEQCPNYPESTVSSCFSSWHEKKVYGLYQARLTGVQCQIYNRSPYNSWFAAWREQRCLSAPEWNDFCAYVDSHPDLAAVLVYPDIWKAARSSACAAEFEKHLGPRLEEGWFFSRTSRGGFRGGEGVAPSRIWRFGAKCRKQ